MCLLLLCVFRKQEYYFLNINDHLFCPISWNCFLRGRYVYRQNWLLFSTPLRALNLHCWVSFQQFKCLSFAVSFFIVFHKIVRIYHFLNTFRASSLVLSLAFCFFGLFLGRPLRRLHLRKSYSWLLLGDIHPSSVNNSFEHQRSSFLTNLLKLLPAWEILISPKLVVVLGQPAS